MQHSLSAFAAPGWRRRLWLGLLLGASLALTLGFACAVPFAAFGAIAALTLPRRDALLLTIALWLANQAIGYAVLQYPWVGLTLVWGCVLGGVAVLTTGAAQAAAAIRPGIVAAAAASFAAAFVVYEGSLYLVSATVTGGAEIYTAPIILRILEINAASFAALLAAVVLATAVSPGLQTIGQTAGE
jgi:hypothetical protein